MVFCFVQKFFTDNTRVRIFFPPHNYTLGYMTKTLNQNIFFSSTKIRIYFSATLGIRIFFFFKNHNPPPPLQVNRSFPIVVSFRNRN
jgi:hypothetical protein